MRFKDDKPVECCICGELVFPGEDYYLYDGDSFCSYKCVGEQLVEDFGDKIKEVHVYTKEEHESIYGDMQYDMMKDEGLLNEHRI